MEVWFYNWAADGKVFEVFDLFGYNQSEPIHIETEDELGDIVVKLIKQGVNVMVHRIPTGFMIKVDTKRFKQR